MMTVSGDSMYPTLHNTEKIWISNLGYTPQNGDIVVVQERNSALNDPIVKRVIATENQKVRFDFENWKVYVDGKELSEDYINYEDWCAMKSYGCPEELTVPPGCIFVMGDNRNHSTDSRDARVSFISEDDVLGKVVLRIFPLNKFGAVND
jgi:signal peptidase I